MLPPLDHYSTVETIDCHFHSYNVVENEAHFALECSLYNTLRDKSPALFENVVLGNLKSFF